MVERIDVRTDEQQDMRATAHAKHVTQRADCRRKRGCVRYGGKGRAYLRQRGVMATECMASHALHAQAERSNVWSECGQADSVLQACLRRCGKVQGTARCHMYRMSCDA
ncbi:hypothetical protein PSAB6_470124 [Paraburkholderia sabiae]|nr:hypothetical protein PSAB6_470124 [Paraburkholderia sabiae]